MSTRLILTLGGFVLFLCGCGLQASPGQSITPQLPGSSAVDDNGLTTSTPPGTVSNPSSRLIVLIIGACFIIIALAGAAGVITHRILTRRR